MHGKRSSSNNLQHRGTQTGTIKRRLKKIAAAEAHCTATRAIYVHKLGVNNVVKRSYQTIPSHLPYWIGLLFSTIQPTPSMRRPVSVKPISCFPLFLSSSLFLLFPYCSHRAKPPLSPPFHPHSLLSDCRSVQVGCTRFSRCCYLIIDLYSPLSKGSWARS